MHGIEHCSGAQVVAADVPFGWPKPFADALQNYEICVALDRDREKHKYRSTDRWVRDELSCLLARDVAPPTPLSVSADKLGVTAMVGTLLLGSLRNGGFNLSPSIRDESPADIEVYPALSLWAWALSHKNYKGNKDRARRKRLALMGRLCDNFDLTVRDERDEANLVGVDHCFDALVAALTGQEYVSGNTFDPPECLNHDTLQLEGWIHCPNPLLT